MKSIEVLVAHGLTERSTAGTVSDTLAFLQNAPSEDVISLNMLGPFDNLLKNSKIEFLIVTNDLLAYRSGPIWRKILPRLSELASRSKFVLIFPQDDFYFSRALVKTVKQLKDPYVFTSLRKNLSSIYGSVDKSRFRYWMTGFVPEDRYRDKLEYAIRWQERPIDLGQRVSKLGIEFGNTGIKKHELACAAADQFKRRNLRVDVSSDPKDFLLGDSWYQFLGKSKFTVNRNSGSSFLVRGLSDLIKSNAIKNSFSNLNFREQVTILTSITTPEVVFEAPSPRIFESAAMGVCQLLEVDNYPGNLIPWEDYIPFNLENKNLDEIFEITNNVDQVQQIISSCNKKLISSDEFLSKTWINNMYSEFGKTTVKIKKSHYGMPQELEMSMSENWSDYESRIQMLSKEIRLWHLAQKWMSI